MKGEEKSACIRVDRYFCKLKQIPLSEKMPDTWQQDGDTNLRCIERSKLAEGKYDM